MDEIQPIEVEARQYAGLLRQAIRAAGFSVSEVERRLGTGPKVLRRVFDGSVDLKFKHVVAVLRIIGMSQQEFFAIASRSASPGSGCLAPCGTCAATTCGSRSREGSSRSTERISNGLPAPRRAARIGTARGAISSAWCGS